MYDPISIQDAAQRYRTVRCEDLAASTRRNVQYRLDRFVEWCGENGVSETDELTGRVVDDYSQDLNSNLARITVKNHLSTVRDFIDYCERIEASPEGIAEKIDIPTLSLSDEVDDTRLRSEQAHAVLEYLDTYEYASLRHTAVLLLWHTGCRMGSLHALDLDDYSSEGRWLQFTHRPDAGTPLKNKLQGQREVNLHQEVCDVLDDYISQTRPAVTDDYGREPLLASAHGRVHEGTIQSQVYTATRPCHYTNECPIGREIEECEATSYNAASKCPDSVGPHALRRGRITYELLEGKPKEYASDRMNVSTDVLDDHYDARSQRERRKQRRQFLDDV